MENFDNTQQEMPLPSELQELAELFPSNSPLFVVGGAVRDYLLHSPLSGDIDICSAISPTEIASILKNSNFKVIEASPRLGTVIIARDNAYEYTTFRKDSYPNSRGTHAPLEVSFTTSIAEDCLRRDFCCNSVYYNIIEKKLVDPLLGINDIQHKILRTCLEGNQTLSEDGLRIMRLARFVSTLNFDVDNQTFDSAKANCRLLADISCERIADELNKLLGGDNPFGGLQLLLTTGALDVILPELTLNNNTPQNAKYHKYDVLTHTFWTVQYAPKQIRLAALFHDVAKTFCLNCDGNMYMHAVVGEKMTKDILTRLKYPKKTIEHTARLVASHMFDLACNTKESKTRLFIAQNFDIIDELISLKTADGMASGFPFESSSVDKLARIKNEIIDKNLPVSLLDLKIKGDDLEALNIRGKDIKMALDELLKKVILEQLPNNKAILVDYVTQKQRRKNKNLL